MIKRFKTKWGIESTRRVVIILVIFSITGISILILKAPIFRLLRIDPDASYWIQVPVAILVYQILILLIGSLFGEFRFFWEKEKRLGRLLIRPFRRN